MVTIASTQKNSCLIRFSFNVTKPSDVIQYVFVRIQYRVGNLIVQTMRHFTGEGKQGVIFNDSEFG